MIGIGIGVGGSGSKHKPGPGAMVNTGHALASGLRLAYLFNDPEATLVDRSGNGVNGAINGSPQRVLGPVGKGYMATHMNLDGVDDWVQVMDAVNPTEYSIVARVRRTAAAADARYVMFRTNGTPAAWSHSLYNVGTYHYVEHVYDGSNVIVTDTSARLNEWVHLVTTSKGGGGGETRLYVNGVSVGTPAAVSGALWTGGDRWWIGRAAIVESGQTWGGPIDHVYLYHRELSAGEVAALAADHYVIF